MKTNETETTPTIHHDYRLEVEPSDQATLLIVAHRWNISAPEALARILRTALDRIEPRTDAETAAYCADLERAAALLKQTNAVTHRTRAIAA